MKLLRLQVQSFAAIGSVDVEFGPGLNVLYGPNDLGKSTVAESIRLALLLPNSSTYAEPYVGWAGGGDPTVELTFETGDQRIWRVRKQFSKTGSSLLQESKDGKDFDDLERGRAVDGKLREILRWGIPEPGGARAPKPNSFLATALLSTQTDVSAILSHSLQSDIAGSGKEQIAEALQAVSQDPLFIELQKETKERRDDAYTERGRPKTTVGSPFREAAERVKQTRIEKEHLETTVEDARGAEQQLRALAESRLAQQDQLQTAMTQLANLVLLEQQAMDRSIAEGRVERAQEQVKSIRDLRARIATAEDTVAGLAVKVTEAEATMHAARLAKIEADAALASAQENAVAEQAQPAVADAQLQLRRNAAERALADAKQTLATIADAKQSVAAASSAEREFQGRQVLAEAASKALVEAETKEKRYHDELRRCDLLLRALELQAAERLVKAARAAVENRANLVVRLEALTQQRALLVAQRAAMTVPAVGLLPAMRRLETELATARGALDVGFVMTITPLRPLDRPVDLVLRRDGEEPDALSLAQVKEVEANVEMEVGITGVAMVRVQGGRREAQARAAALESRWSQEVVPHLVAAGVGDIDRLHAKVAEARQLDAGMQQKDLDRKALQDQIVPLSVVEEAHRHAAGQAEACLAAMGDVDLQPLLLELVSLGADANAKLTRRRQQLSNEIGVARDSARKAAGDHVVAIERVKQARRELDAAFAARDVALQPFPQGLAVAEAATHTGHAACVGALQTAEQEWKSVAAAVEAARSRIEMAQRDARAAVAKAAAAVAVAQQQLEQAKTEHASLDGRLTEMRERSAADNLSLAEDTLREAKEQLNALPLPGRMVSHDEVVQARTHGETLQATIDDIKGEIQRARGALEQTGGAVARGRLVEATDAFESAERHERETEAEYEAWKLLLEQMKEADAAQASNLGQSLVPAIAAGFSKLTRQRYQAVKLDPHLETEGVMVAGALRPVSHLSVGTREQLSTLFRLSLAEYLHTTIVLDDQLVQSDGSRMEWFRELLAEKARLFQIIVLTCRPSDYLPPTAILRDGVPVCMDIAEEPIRAIDLGRALHRR